MSIENFFMIVVVVILVLVVYKVLVGNITAQIQTKDQKREEIINSYKKQLQEAIEDVKDDKEQRMAKKGELLKAFSVELSRNIFFDSSEIREIIMILSKEG